MLEITGIALATFFSTIGPLDVAAVFAALTTSATPAERRSYAVRGILIASVILGVFALTGDFLLAGFGISMAALRTAGGVLLLLIGIDMVFARQSGAITTTSEEIDEARLKHDISVFPLATPLIAGPGTMGAVILLMADAKGNFGPSGGCVVSVVGDDSFYACCIVVCKPDSPTSGGNRNSCHHADIRYFADGVSCSVYF